MLALVRVTAYVMSCTVYRSAHVGRKNVDVVNNIN